MKAICPDIDFSPRPPSPWVKEVQQWSATLKRHLDSKLPMEDIRNEVVKHHETRLSLLDGMAEEIRRRKERRDGRVVEEARL